MISFEQRRLMRKYVIYDMAGEDQVFTYANMALKTQVEKLLLSHTNEGTE